MLPSPYPSSFRLLRARRQKCRAQKGINADKRVGINAWARMRVAGWAGRVVSIGIGIGRGTVGVNGCAIV